MRGKGYKGGGGWGGAEGGRVCVCGCVRHGDGGGGYTCEEVKTVNSSFSPGTIIDVCEHTYNHFTIKLSENQVV